MGCVAKYLIKIVCLRGTKKMNTVLLLKLFLPLFACAYVIHAFKPWMSLLLFEVKGAYLNALLQ